MLYNNRIIHNTTQFDEESDNINLNSFVTER